MMPIMNKKTAIAISGPKQTGSSRGSLVGGSSVGLGSSQSSGGPLIPRTAWGRGEFNISHGVPAPPIYREREKGSGQKG